MRDKIARKIDRPPFKVMNDSVLVQLAKEQPQSEKALYGIKGLGTKLLQHDAPHLLRAIYEGRTASPPQYHPNHHRPDDDTIARYEALRQWRNSLATERGVEPDVIISNNTLMDIARRNPKTLSTLTKMGVLGNWQFENYGQTLLNVLKRAAVQVN
jgi:ribonuclease D